MQRHFVYISGKAGGQACKQVSVKRVAAYAAYPFEFRHLVAVFVVSRPSTVTVALDVPLSLMDFQR